MALFLAEIKGDGIYEVGMSCSLEPLYTVPGSASPILKAYRNCQPKPTTPPPSSPHLPPLAIPLSPAKKKSKRSIVAEAGFGERAAKSVIYDGWWLSVREWGPSWWMPWARPKARLSKFTQLCKCWKESMKAKKPTYRVRDILNDISFNIVTQENSVECKSFQMFIKEKQNAPDGLRTKASLRFSEGKQLTMNNCLRRSKSDVPSRSISINYCKPGLALQTMIWIRLIIASLTYELSKCQSH